MSLKAFSWEIFQTDISISHFFKSIFSLCMLNLNLNRNTPCKLHDVSTTVTRLKVAAALNLFTTQPDAERGVLMVWTGHEKQVTNRQLS